MTLTMRAEVRDAWADALESGEYQQTKAVLATVEHRGDGYVVTGACCLGVLCVLAVKAGVIPDPAVTGGDEVGACFEYGEGDFPSSTGLPVAVVEWAGMHRDGLSVGLDDPPLTSPEGVSRSAATWNDDYDATFDDIAVMVRQIPAD